eukprot:scaffold17575_cov33-Tisochrysis_lutea.AAC.4
MEASHSTASLISSARSILLFIVSNVSSGDVACELHACSSFDPATSAAVTTGPLSSLTPIVSATARAIPSFQLRGCVSEADVPSLLPLLHPFREWLNAFAGPEARGSFSIVPAAEPTTVATPAVFRKAATAARPVSCAGAVVGPPLHQWLVGASAPGSNHPEMPINTLSAGTRVSVSLVGLAPKSLSG